jgi:RNA polymerase sigma factor (sigma-70 family)
LTLGRVLGHRPVCFTVLKGPPEAILAVLRSAATNQPDPRLGDVLAAFRRDWETLARRRYAALGGDLEDALQAALVKLVAPERLATLEDPARLEAWARSIFVHAVLDLVRDLRRHQGLPLSGGDDDPDGSPGDQFPATTPSPEEVAAGRERLAIVVGVIGRLEVARLRFVEDLPEKEIARRLDLSRDGVAGQLKRIRKALRRALGEPD